MFRASNNAQKGPLLPSHHVRCLVVSGQRYYIVFAFDAEVVAKAVSLYHKLITKLSDENPITMDELMYPNDHILQEDVRTRAAVRDSEPLAQRFLGSCTEREEARETSPLQVSPGRARVLLGGFTFFDDVWLSVACLCHWRCKVATEEMFSIHYTSAG